LFHPRVVVAFNLPQRKSVHETSESYGLRLRRMTPNATYHFGEVGAAGGTREAMLVSVPLVFTFVAKDEVALAGGSAHGGRGGPAQEQDDTLLLVMDRQR